MWHLVACKSVSLSFLNWIKNEMTFFLSYHRINVTLIHRYSRKIISFQERETNLNFTGCQVPHFMIVLIPCISLLNLSLRIKCLFFEEYGAFNTVVIDYPKHSDTGHY